MLRTAHSAKVQGCAAEDLLNDGAHQRFGGRRLAQRGEGGVHDRLPGSDFSFSQFFEFEQVGT
jgi:hypothetical protein